MTHIFIFDIVDKVLIYEEQVLKHMFKYEDSLFLENYSEYDVYYIGLSNNSLDLPNYLSNWKDKVTSYLHIDTECYFWFMEDGLQFKTTSDEAAAHESYHNNEGLHVFVGGAVENTKYSYSFDEFCKLLIELYHPKKNLSSDDNLLDEISDLKKLVIALTDKVDAMSSSSTKSDENEQTEEQAKMLELKEELSQYRSDFYLKSVQRAGMDSLLEVWENMYLQLYNSRNKDEEVKSAIKFGLNLTERSLKTRFNVRFVQSQQGDKYDEETMIADPSECVPTNDPNQKHCVAYSLSPAVYWTIPRVNSSEIEFLYKEENVVLYL